MLNGAVSNHYHVPIISLQHSGYSRPTAGSMRCLNVVNLEGTDGMNSAVENLFSIEYKW